MSDCISHNGEQWVRLAWYEQRGGDLVAAEDHIRDLETQLAAATARAEAAEHDLGAIFDAFAAYKKHYSISREFDIVAREIFGARLRRSGCAKQLAGGWRAIFHGAIESAKNEATNASLARERAEAAEKRAAALDAAGVVMAERLHQAQSFLREMRVPQKVQDAAIQAFVHVLPLLESLSNPIAAAWLARAKEASDGTH